MTRWSSVVTKTTLDAAASERSKKGDLKNQRSDPNFESFSCPPSLPEGIKPLNGTNFLLQIVFCVPILLHIFFCNGWEFLLHVDPPWCTFYAKNVLGRC